MNLARKLLAALAALSPFGVSAATTIQNAQEPVIRAGTSGLWILANISYAGMRAQDSRSSGWRIVAFIFGFPGTFVSFVAIREGGGRAFGIELPGRKPTEPGA